MSQSSPPAIYEEPPLIDAGAKTRVRIPQIIQGLVRGESLERIADRLGVDRKTVYRDRRTIQYHEFVNDLMDVQLRELEELRTDPKTRVEALKESGRMIRAGVVRQTFTVAKKDERILISLYSRGPKIVEAERVA